MPSVTLVETSTELSKVTLAAAEAAAQSKVNLAAAIAARLAAARAASEAASLLANTANADPCFQQLSFDREKAELALKSSEEEEKLTKAYDYENAQLWEVALKKRAEKLKQVAAQPESHLDLPTELTEPLTSALLENAKKLMKDGYVQTLPKLYGAADKAAEELKMWVAYGGDEKDPPGDDNRKKTGDKAPRDKLTIRIYQLITTKITEWLNSLADALNDLGLAGAWRAANVLVDPDAALAMPAALIPVLRRINQLEIEARAGLNDGASGMRLLVILWIVQWTARELAQTAVPNLFVQHGTGDNLSDALDEVLTQATAGVDPIGLVLAHPDFVWGVPPPQ